jgi:Ni/Fe-hydrogenase subunit HybB-like protein
MLASLAGLIVPLQFVFVVLRLTDLWWRGNLGLLFAGDAPGMMAAIEIALFLAPVAMLASARRPDLGQLVRVAMVMMFAGALYRFDTYLVAFTPGAHWSYFPSVQEILITLGLVAGEVMAYIAIVKFFPILGGLPAGTERQAVS